MLFRSFLHLIPSRSSWAISGQFQPISPKTLMGDSPFQIIVEQARREAKRLVKRQSRIYAQSDFLKRIQILLGPDLRRLSPKCFDPLESIVSEDSSTGDVAVFVPNDPNFVKFACEKLKLFPNMSRTIFIMPIYGRMSQKAVEESGIEKDITVEEFHAEIMMLEEYLFLVPAPHCFRRVFCEADIDDLTSISRALVKFEILHGTFPLIHAFGPNAMKTKHIMQEMRAQIGRDAFTTAPTFKEIIIIDRSCDIFTPLLTQFTYGGIIDENLEVDYNMLKIPETIKWDGGDTIVISDSDLAFQELRGLPLEQAVERVKTELDEIKETQSKLKPGLDVNTFRIMKAKGERLKELKPLLSLHLEIMGFLANKKKFEPNFSETIEFEYQSTLGLLLKPPAKLSDYFMLTDENWDEAIRLYCISSVFARGLSSKDAANIRRMILLRFGMEALDDIEYLARGHLLEPEVPFYKIIDRFHDLPKYEQLNKIFKLMVDPKDETDLGNFYGGYVPLTVRLVENTVNRKIDGNNKMINLLEQNRTPYYRPENLPKKSIFSKEPEPDRSIVEKYMVFVIGGMTASEISMIRAMSMKFHQGSKEFYIGTTSILTGKKLINEVCPCIAKLNPWKPPPPEKKK